MQKKNYDTEALRLVRAIDFAIESLEKFPPKDFTSVNLESFIKFYSELKSSVLNPLPQFKKIVSLNYSIQEVFTYFQEANGKEVDYFWEQISSANLGYIREDLLQKILKRGKIRGRIEYEYVIDSIVVAEQVGRITKEETQKLSNMIGLFETKR